MGRRHLIKAFVATIVGFVGLSSSVSAGRRRRHEYNLGPSSVAGVRRRTTRRTRRRIHRNMRLTSLPYGCSVTQIRNNETYYYCGGIWYRPAYQGTTVIYIVEEIESGADTEVEFDSIPNQ